MTAMSIDRQVVTDGLVRLAVGGEIDLTTTDALAEAIRDVITANPAQLVVDLDQVTSMDSSGANALVAGQRLAAAHGIVFVVTNPHGRVRRIMDWWAC
jgi:anti-anti-sigma factor